MPSTEQYQRQWNQDYVTAKHRAKGMRNGGRVSCRDSMSRVSSPRRLASHCPIRMIVVETLKSLSYQLHLVIHQPESAIRACLSDKTTSAVTSHQSDPWARVRARVTTPRRQDLVIVNNSLAMENRSPTSDLSLLYDHTLSKATNLWGSQPRANNWLLPRHSFGFFSYIPAKPPIPGTSRPRGRSHKTP